MNKIITGVDYEDGQCVGVMVSGITGEQAPVYFERVRHGRWIEKEKYTFGVMYDCSICGDRILDNGHSWSYCPNCGAKMDRWPDCKGQCERKEIKNDNH